MSRDGGVKKIGEEVTRDGGVEGMGVTRDGGVKEEVTRDGGAEGMREEVTRDGGVEGMGEGVREREVTWDGGVEEIGEAMIGYRGEHFCSGSGTGDSATGVEGIREVVTRDGRSGGNRGGSD